MYKKYPKGLKLTAEKQKLVDDNYKLALKLSHKWYNGVVDFEDIKQEAFLVLVDCATKFDLNAGAKFTTYAYNCINIRLNNYVQSYNKLVNIPLNKIYKIYRYLQLPDEEKEAFRIESKITNADIEFYNTYEIISMDLQINDDYEDCKNYYYSEELGYNEVDNNSAIDKIVNNLHIYIKNSLDKQVFLDIIKSNFEPDEYKNIAKKYNIKLRDVYSILERCQKIMSEHKNELI